MNANGTSTEEEFKVVKFIENNAPFAMLLGKPWIEGVQARRKEEEILEQKKQELKDFMTRRIKHLIEEHENRAKLFKTRDLDVEVGITLEDPQKSEVPILDIDEVLPLKKSHQREVTLPKKDKNQNGKMNTETNLTRKKARKLSKKRAKIDKLQKVLEGTSQKENLQNWSFARIIEQRHMTLLHGEAI
jgi:hypothetical protein